MAKKGNKKRAVAQPKPSPGGRQSVQWIIVAAMLFFFSAGFVLKMVIAPVSGTGIGHFFCVGEDPWQAFEEVFQKKWEWR